MDFSLLILLAAGFLAAGISFSNHFRRPLLPSFLPSCCHAREKAVEPGNQPTLFLLMITSSRSFFLEQRGRSEGVVGRFCLPDRPGPRARTHARTRMLLTLRSAMRIRGMEGRKKKSSVNYERTQHVCDQKSRGRIFGLFFFNFPST